MTIYTANCSKCKTKTPQAIHCTNRLRGFRLMCLKCGTVQKRYTKANKLEEIEQ